jgi:phosphoribosylformylglycinamidine (FGAM) synthase-like enzyme
VILFAGAPQVSLDGSEYQALYGEPAGRPASLDLAAEAALVDGVHRAAPACSLVHDAAEGGLAVCLAEAALVSGIGAELDLPDDPVALFGEGGGQVVLACAPGAISELPVPTRQIGSVGGASVLGVPVEELRQAWEVP